MILLAFIVRKKQVQSACGVMFSLALPDLWTIEVSSAQLKAAYNVFFASFFFKFKFEIIFRMFIKNTGKSMMMMGTIFIPIHVEIGFKLKC